MSYILEALKKAQAERELGRVPQLQTAALGSQQARPGALGHPPRRVVSAWLLALPVLALVLWGAWWQLAARGTGPQSSVSEARGATGKPPAAAVASTPLPADTTQAPGINTRSPQSALPPVLPPPLPPVPAVAPVASPAPAATLADAAPNAAQTPAPGNGATGATGAAGATGATRAAATPAPTTASQTAKPPPPADLDALAPELRRRLPTLAIGGTIHSAQRAERMVILDGQVLREGERLTPELSVLRIEPQGVWLQLSGSLGTQQGRLKP